LRFVGPQRVPHSHNHIHVGFAKRYDQRSDFYRPLLFTANRGTDFVQDLYIKELKAYKAPPAVRICLYQLTKLLKSFGRPQPKDAHVGVVKTYSAPSPPKVPVLPSDLASELSAYDASEPTKAEVFKKTATNQSEDMGTGADAYLGFLEQDLPKAEEAHH
jgi:F-type H+-transporting ATPase subunit h